MARQFLPEGRGVVHLPDVAELVQAEEDGIFFRQEHGPPVEADAPRPLPVPGAAAPARTLIPHAHMADGKTAAQRLLPH